MTDGANRSDFFGSQRYEVEHALTMYAYSYVHLPAAALYDSENLQPFAETIESCHIYFIGYLPLVSIAGSEQRGRTVFIHLDCLGERKSVSWDFPEGAQLRHVEPPRFSWRGAMVLDTHHRPIKFSPVWASNTPTWNLMSNT